MAWYQQEWSEEEVEEWVRRSRSELCVGVNSGISIKARVSLLVLSLEGPSEHTMLS